MPDHIHPGLKWAPLILIVLFAAFLSIFSMDVFQEGHSPGRLVLELLGHNLPSLLLLVIAALAWRWPWVGAVACAALGVFYIVWAWGAFPLSAYVTIAGPLFVISILYAIGWRKKPAEG